MPLFVVCFLLKKMTYWHIVIVMNVLGWVKFMKLWVLVVWLMLCAPNSFAAVGSKPLKICLDSANWMPFIYQEDGQAKGLHIDTIKQSLNEMGVPFEFISSPWKRCLKGAEKGAFDAIATASYNDERAVYLHYPSDAQLSLSDFRVGQVQYNIIVHHSSNFQYSEELTFMPQPTRVSRDYSIGKDLKAMGFAVDDSSINDLQNLKRLVREKNGAVVALPTLVDWANKQKEFAGQIRLIEKPLKSKSYFLVFSKNGRVDEVQASEIWKKIRTVRDANEFKEYLPENKSKSID